MASRSASDSPQPPAPDSEYLPLQGLTIVDAASLFAGPLLATHLGDLGADVLEIERPEGDALRALGPVEIRSGRR